MDLSPNARAILLLTAPLIAGQSKSSVNPLSAGEYRRIAQQLRELRCQPADLLEAGAKEVLKKCRLELDTGRLERLLGRGFLLSQAMERWQTRAIWVVSRADAGYPQRLKKRLGKNAPAVLYGCGDPAILDTGGLAVVGSRKVSELLIAFTEGVGQLAALAQRTLISGGARGIDQAAMRGAMEAGGRVAGVLADSLEKAAMRRENREALMEGRLVLMCPYDPAARFHVGHAMQRNKLIYALADAALAVNSDYGKGGTWTGAIEQLHKLNFVPVYVRADGSAGKGLNGLREQGAKPWPNPKTQKDLEEIFDMAKSTRYGAPEQQTLSAEIRDEAPPFEHDRQGEPTQSTEPAIAGEAHVMADSMSAGELFAKVDDLLGRMDGPMTESEIADKVGVQVLQVRRCLKSMLEKGAVEKLSRPVRYRSAANIGPLFDQTD